MSKENVKRFYDAMAKDPALQQKSRAITQRHAGQKLDQAQLDVIFQQELIPVARGAGYDFTLEELKAYAKETGKIGPREVSEEELAAVAGGASCVCVIGGSGETLDCTCVGAGWGGGGKCVCVLGGGG